MRIAILGFDKQGHSAFDYWQQGNEITICDRNTAIEVPPNVETQLGADYLNDLERFHLIIRTPGLHPKDIVAANGERILRKVTTVTEEFFRNCPAKIIGVTGTKGKGTTSSLITELLRAAGNRVHLGGNIGVPPLDMLKDNIASTDWVVLELANYQLIDLHVSPPVAVCLMVVPEHLDWHTDMAEYITAKKNIFRYQDDDDLAVFNRLNDFSGEVVDVSPALKRSYEVPAKGQIPQERNGAFVDGDTIYYDDQAVCKTTDVALLGRHNLENVCAAIAATWDIIDGNTQLITQVVQTFKGLPHRLELIRELDGVKYYNDSFGTTPESAIAAVEAFEQPKVMILGGHDKGASYAKLAACIAINNVRGVVLIGNTADKINTALRTAGYTHVVDGGQTMDSMVHAAKSLAQNGDVVLLSTASASFGLFSDYVDRGEQFRTVVQALA